MHRHFHPFLGGKEVHLMEQKIRSMNEVVHTSPTIGSNVEEIVVNNTRFLMWDIGGQESLRSSWNTYYTNTEFVIVVVDSTDRERISVTKEELYKILAHEDLRKAGLLIFANKQDVKNCMTVAEISQFLKLTSIKDHQWHIQACCALTGEGLNISNLPMSANALHCPKKEEEETTPPPMLAEQAIVYTQGAHLTLTNSVDITYWNNEVSANKTTKFREQQGFCKYVGVIAPNT
ncbi:ADP-ribosylation factor-like protein 5A isoform X2 [Ahaetulla prasina]|uniref:ADP-ribosylation factor-like protein 5A isoform X2 n=1 Tax=Ahaetulla prasina TaxID=499056 RepID=UPI002648FFB1|nr:ADP-ribosylation factor-like protein 5A isoform X2 [Ahaetulla prasina]